MGRALVYLGSTARDGEVRLENGAQWGIGEQFTNPTDGDVRTVACSHNGEYVCVVRTTNLIRIYETRSYSIVQSWNQSGGFVRVAAWSPDDTKLALGAIASPYLSIYDTSTWAAYSATDTAIHSAGLTGIPSLDWSPNSRYIAFRGYAGSISTNRLKVYDALTTSPTTVTTKDSVSSHFGEGVAWSPDGTHLIFAGHASTTNIITIYETTGWTAVSNPTGYPTNARPHSVSWKDNYVVIAGSTPLAFLYAYDTGGSNDATTWTLTSHSTAATVNKAVLTRGSNAPVRLFYYSDSTRRVYIATPPDQVVGSHAQSDELNVSDTVNGIDAVNYPEVVPTPPKLIAFAIGSTSPFLRFLNEEGGLESVALDPVLNGGCWAVGFDPDGSRIAVSTQNSVSGFQEVRVYEVAPPHSLLNTPYTGPDINAWVDAIAFSPDSSKLAIALETAPGLKIFDGATYAAYSPLNVDILSANFAYPGVLSWSPNSRYIAMSVYVEDLDATVRRVYDCNTTTPTLVVAASQDGDAAVHGGSGAWSPDGTRFLSGILEGGNPLTYYETTGWTTQTLPSDLPTVGEYYIRWAGDYIWLAGRNAGYGYLYDTGGSNDATTWVLIRRVRNMPTGYDVTVNSNYDVVDGVQFVTTNAVGSFLYSDPEMHPVTAVNLQDILGLIGTDASDADMVTMAPPAGIEYDEDVGEATEISDVATGAAAPNVSQAVAVSTALFVSAGPTVLSDVVLSDEVMNSLDTISAEIVRVTAAMDSQALLHLDVSGLAQLTAALQTGFTVLITEMAQLDDIDDSFVDRFHELSESVLTSAVISSMLQAQSVLAEAFAIASMAATFNDADATEEMTLEASSVALLRANELVEAMFQLQGVVGLTVDVFVSLPESIQVAALPTSQAELNELLTEVFRVGALVDVSGEVFTVLATNMTSSATTRYTNYAFNSIARIGVDYVGAADDGLYLLEGETDDGDPIYAGIKTGLMDFGIPELKRVMNAYVGLTRAGRLLMKVVTANRKDETPTERWYALKQNARGGDVVGSRFELGRGIKSRYWQFEAVNVDGDDFEWDVLDLDLIRLSRRS